MENRMQQVHDGARLAMAGMAASLTTDAHMPPKPRHALWRASVPVGVLLVIVLASIAAFTLM